MSMSRGQHIPLLSTFGLITRGEKIVQRLNFKGIFSITNVTSGIILGQKSKVKVKVNLFSVCNSS